MGVDRIVCGDCQSFFPLSCMESFLLHKSTSCEFNQLECSQCSKLFGSLWSLIEHAQDAHNTRIISEDAEIESCCRRAATREKACCSSEATVGVAMADAAIQTCQDPLGIRGCEKRSRRSVAKSSDENGRLCCDREECGISVMPGTHENLKKCCSGVVPKKRKRHIEMKHLQAFKLKKKAMERARMSSPGIDRQIQPSISNTVSDKLTSFDITSDVQDVDDIITSITGIQDAPVTRTGQDPIEGVDTPDATNLILDSLMQHFTKSPDALPLISSFLPNPLSTASFPLDNPEMPPPPPPLSPEPAPLNISFTNLINVSSTNTKKRQYPTSRPFKCTVCGLSFNQRIHLKKHESKHTGIKPYKCDQCNYATVERSHLRVHMRTHTGEKPYKCMFCDYATAQNSTLKIHLHRHHREEMSKETCIENALNSL